MTPWRRLWRWIGRRRERPGDAAAPLAEEVAPEEEGEASVVDSLSDTDLRVLVSRLPSELRAVIVMRHMLGLDLKEVADIRGEEPEAVERLHEEAIEIIEAMVESFKKPRTTRRGRRMPTVTRVKRMPVIRERRFALVSASTRLTR